MRSLRIVIDVVLDEGIEFNRINIFDGKEQAFYLIHKIYESENDMRITNIEQNNEII